MRELPINPIDADGLIVKLKESVPLTTLSNFGNKEYVFTISKVNPDLSINDRIRLFPIEEYPNGRIHILAIMLGYEKLRCLFQVIDKIS